jgi:hypothetical protein
MDDLSDSVIKLICLKRENLLGYIDSIAINNPSHFLIPFFLKRHFILKKDILQKGSLSLFQITVLLADLPIPIELKELMNKHFKLQKNYFIAPLSKLLVNIGVL